MLLSAPDTAAQSTALETAKTELAAAIVEQPAEVVAYLGRQLLRLASAELDEESEAYADIKILAAYAVSMAGDFRLANSLAEEALQILKEQQKPDLKKLGIAHQMLAELNAAQSLSAAAEEEFDLALELLEDGTDPGDPALIQAMVSYAEFELVNLGDYARAKTRWNDALKSLEEAFGADSIETVPTLMRIARLTIRQGQFSDALDYLMRIQINLESNEINDEYSIFALRQIHLGLANVHLALGDGENASIHRAAFDELGGDDRNGINLVPVKRDPPIYPITAAALEGEGYARLQYTVLEDGTVTNILILESFPTSHFGAAAIAAAKDWLYEPPLDDEGNPMRVVGARTTVTFQMEY